MSLKEVSAPLSFDMPDRCERLARCARRAADVGVFAVCLWNQDIKSGFLSAVLIAFQVVYL